MSDLLINLPVYEPAGRDIRLSESDLLQHVLIIGATGSGKTTLLHRILTQTIQHGDIGLLVLDAKQDDTVQRITRLAAQHHRHHIVLGPQGSHYLDLFQPLQSLADVGGMVKRLLTGSGDMGLENTFWNEFREAMLDAALTLLVEQGVPVQYEAALQLMNEFFFHGSPWKTLNDLAERIGSRLDRRSPLERRKLKQTLATVAMWKTMEGRARSNVQATLVNALRPFAGLDAGRCFEPGNRPAGDAGQVAHRGGICVLSVNATTEPALAGLLFKLVKTDFLDVVQRRRDGEGPLCGIIADELPLLVTSQDVETLATVRSRRCFVCAATQGLSILDEKLGTRQRKALLANFGTIIFLRNREEETDAYALWQLGLADFWERTPRLREMGDLLSLQPERVRHQKPVCPPGTLGRLEPHQGFVALPRRQKCELPLWFVPHFEESTPVFSPPVLTDPASVERLHLQLQKLGYQRHLDSSQLQAALKLFPVGKKRRPALKKAKEFFSSRAVIVPEELGELPLPWLIALPGILWSLRQPHWTKLPYMIRKVTVAGGLLQLHFAQEAAREAHDNHVGGFDRVRIAVNTRLYPSCYRPLNRRHAIKLMLAQPDLEP